MNVQLYVRSVYSLLSSMCTVSGMVKKAKEYGYSSLALVDKNVLSGALAFKKEAIKNNIKPIFGLEFEIEVNERILTCLLYAKNDDGFLNLMGLSSYINTNDNKVIGLDVLNKYRSNNFLVLLSDSMFLTFAIDKGEDEDEAMKLQKEYFGDDYLVGIINQNIARNATRNIKIKEILKKYNIKTIALSKTLYLEKEDYKEFEVLKCIRDKRVLKDDEYYYDEGRHFLSIEEYKDLYAEEDLKNNDILSSMCNVNIDCLTSLPSFPCPNGIKTKDYLIALCKEGLKRRLKGNIKKEYKDRLDYELKIILNMHFEDYFLIVYDFILHAKRNNILVGPGRGSAAGSLVAYCLGITDIDPIRYGLIFERFLNPERISMPDIDTDFPDNRRDEMFEYIKEKYGIDHVGHIVTYGTLKAKQVLRDTGRALGYNLNEVDMICKSIPNTIGMTLKDAINISPLFKQTIYSSSKYQDLYKTALKFEGFPRHESTHAAGIVMSKKPLNEVVPVIKIEDDLNSTQYTMEHLEELGLIKMDFLSIKNLSTVQEIVDDIKTNQNSNFDIKNIPLDDSKTFELIDNVNLLGVFQLESNGMQNLARKMKPRNFEELGMMIALFRPGPMENIPKFLENRANPSNIKYFVPALMPILEETYGIIVYQEQIMSIARTLAGFSYGKADILRRAMSKKKANELESLQNDFIKGCIKNGYDSNVATQIYDLVLKFANYGFNKSHSVVYSYVAYWLAYLKANYSKYFYKALLNSVIGSQEKTYDYLLECNKVKQEIKGISINKSTLEYVIEEDAILMPLTICKDVGRVSAIKILEERNTNGAYKDYIDCIKRLYNYGIEKNVLENLINAGALDEFTLSRYTMNSSLANVIKYANAHKGDTSLFEGLDDAPIIENHNDDKQVRAEKEKSALGFYFSYNPILEVKKQKKIDALPIKQLKESNDYVKGFGMIRRIKTHRTKKGDMMAFADINDDSGELSIVLMPNIYAICQEKLKEGKYILFEGKMEKENSLLVKKAQIL